MWFFKPVRQYSKELNGFSVCRSKIKTVRRNQCLSHIVHIILFIYSFLNIHEGCTLEQEHKRSWIDEESKSYQMKVYLKNPCSALSAFSMLMMCYFNPEFTSDKHYARVASTPQTPDLHQVSVFVYGRRNSSSELFLDLNASI